MAIVARELSIIYGSTTIGKGTDYIIDGKFRMDKSYERAFVSCEVIATGSSEAAFATACSDLETAFRTPRQRLRVLFNSTSHLDLNPASTTNTGFNAAPTIRKTGTQSDTGRSRRYEITVTVDLPADLSGQSGRRSSSVNLTETDSRRRRLIVTGEYAASGTNLARAQYVASIDAYLATLIAAIGGTWEGPFDIRAEANDTDTSLVFSQTYEELIYNQSRGTLNDTRLRRQRLTVRQALEAPGDSPLGEAIRFSTIVVDYDAAVDKTVTTSLQSVYDSTVYPFLVDQARAMAGGNSFAVVEEIPHIDLAENRIAARLTIKATGASKILAVRATTVDEVNTGKDLVPVWTDDANAKHVFQGPSTVARTVTITTLELAGSGNQSASLGGGGGSDQFGIFGINKPTAYGVEIIESSGKEAGIDNFFFGGGVKSAGSSGGGGGIGAKGGKTEPADLTGIVIGSHSEYTPLKIGFPGAETLDVIERVETVRIVYVAKVLASGAPTGKVK